MSKPIQKKGPSNKPEEKKEVEKLNQFVQYIKPDNSIVLYQEKQGKEPVVVRLAHVLVPRYDKKEKKHETFDYECHEFLRKKLVTGKKVRFDVVSKKDAKIKYVVPYVQKENIVVSLLEKGYAYLMKDGASIKEYNDAFNKAKEAKVGIHNENAASLASKQPEDPKFNEKAIKNFIEKKTVLNGYIVKASSPAIFKIETEDRKVIEVKLYGVDQYLRFNPTKKMFDFDEDAYAAMDHIRKHYQQRDCAVRIVSTDKYGPLALITVDGKDVGEDLLKRGFVVCPSKIEYSEEIKQKYIAAEKEAKKNHAARWTDFDQAEEDRIIAEQQRKKQQIEDRIKNAPIVKGEVVHIGKVIKVKAGEKEFRINLASVTPIFKQGDEKYNDLVHFRIKEVLRKALVGKKNVEFKEAYKFTHENQKGEKITDVYYDAYSGKKNVAFTLIENGLVTIRKQTNVFERSFDYEEMLKVTKGQYNNKPVTFYKAGDELKKKYEGVTTECIVERVYNPVHFLIYIPKDDTRMTVNLDHCRIPRDEENKEKLEKFLEEATNNVRSMFGIAPVDIEFTRISKRNDTWSVNCEIFVKKTNLVDYVLKHGFAMPFGGYEKVDISELRENQEQIYQFGKKQEQKEEKKPKERVKKEVVKEIKFDDGKKVYVVGFDGLRIYYYEQAADAEYLKELCQQLRALPKGPIEMKEGNNCIVEIKGVQYRGKILAVAQGANTVQCVDTGLVCICGKGKMKPITEEFAKKEFKKPQSVALCGIKPLGKEDPLFKTMMEEVSQFYNKEATIYINQVKDKEETKETAKVMFGEECLNVHLLRQGLSKIDRFFNDTSKWGVEMREAMQLAQKEFLNIYRFGELEDEEEKKH